MSTKKISKYILIGDHVINLESIRHVCKGATKNDTYGIRITYSDLGVVLLEFTSIDLMEKGFELITKALLEIREVGKDDSEHQLLNLDKMERFALEQAIRESHDNKTKAAELLSISRDTLYRKLKQFGID